MIGTTPAQRRWCAEARAAACLLASRLVPPETIRRRPGMRQCSPHRAAICPAPGQSRRPSGNSAGWRNDSDSARP